MEELKENTAAEETELQEPEITEPQESEKTEPQEAEKAEPESKRGRLLRSGRVKFVGAFALGFAACLAVFAAVMYGAGLGRVISKADYDYYEKLNDQYGKYYVIMKMIDNDPLVRKTPKLITDKHVKDMISGIGDPYAEYYTAEEFKEFSKPFEGGYVGIGILVGQTDDGILVEQVYEDGPAYGAGMKEGDYILRVDGVVPKDLDDAVSRMTGEEGTDVTVTVGRNGKEIDLDMKRKSINLDSVGYAVSEDDPDVGYIRLAIFSEDSDEEFENAVKELQKKGCSKFILDLRDNGGGLTNVSINIADYLLPECVIMTEVSKDGTEKEYKSKADSADLDMVVLVNENTASASEILTAAIKENDAGTVLGSKTFGKGVTQISRQFNDGTAVKMTVTEYLTPDGNHVQDQGIEPDIEATDEDILDKALEALGE